MERRIDEPRWMGTTRQDDPWVSNRRWFPTRIAFHRSFVVPFNHVVQPRRGGTKQVHDGLVGQARRPWRMEEELRRAKAQLNTTRGAKKALEKEREKLLDQLKASRSMCVALEKKMQEGSAWNATTSVLGETSAREPTSSGRGDTSEPNAGTQNNHAAWRKKVLELEDDNHALAERIVKLEARIRSYKAKKQQHVDGKRLETARERLLLEVQEQEGWIERLTSENQALQRALDEERMHNERWRKHTKQLQTQNEHLKELLAEGIQWQHDKRTPSQPADIKPEPNGTDAPASKREEALIQQLEEAIGHSEELKVALADKQYKLLQAKEDTSRLRRAYGPILSGIQAHILDTVAMQSER